MIEAKELVKKMGKKKFIEFATHSQSKQTGAYLERQRRWGKASERYCTTCHGWFKDACKCHKDSRTKNPDFQPYFNIGLGCYVESRSEEKRVAKTKGLREAG